MWYRICHFPISYDLINSCQVRDKFSSTKLLGTKFSWNRYFVWDIPLWIFQKVPTWFILIWNSGWAKKNCTASVLYLSEVWVPVQTGPVTPIFLGSVRYSRQFAVSSLDRWSRLDFPFSYILEKRKKPRLVSNAQTQLKMSDCDRSKSKEKKCLISSKFLIHFWRW